MSSEYPVFSIIAVTRLRREIAGTSQLEGWIFWDKIMNIEEKHNHMYHSFWLNSLKPCGLVFKFKNHGEGVDYGYM